MTRNVRRLMVLLACTVCGFAQPVSVARLLHKTPPKAWASLYRAQKLFAAGAASQVEKELERALALDPGFPEAHCNLGVMYMVMNRTTEAATEFRRAVDLDPGNAVYHTNLGAALTALGRLDDGEAEARTAIGLDSTSPQAHCLLGLLLARHGDTRPSAEWHLKYAGQRLPVARETLERLHRPQEAAGGGQP